MDAHSLILLEFSRIREELAGYCLCADSVERLAGLGFAKTEAELAPLREQVCFLFELLNRGEEGFGQDLPAIGFLFDPLEIDGHVLEQDEIFAIGLFIRRSSRLQAWGRGSGKGAASGKGATSGKGAASGKGALQDPFERDLWPDLSAIEEQVFKIFNADGEIRDIPELKAIRLKIKGLEDTLERAGKSLINDENFRRYLQSPLPTLRDGRTVLALKANYRGRVSGIVHELSASGQTVFVEPTKFVELNNLIRLAKDELAIELNKIFRRLSGQIRQARKDIRQLWQELINFDIQRARALYTRNNKNIFADTGKTLALRQGRHPLLGRSAVPIDIVFSKDTRTVIITGPNTGGKTVSLKTVGLLALMNQFGLGIPAGEDSVLPVFDQICADIGDEQSINQSLSTFSAHMKNISHILSEVGDKSLVLLDELGSGTDPQEGSAIAMALLDELIRRQCTVLTTTHHGILKNYGFTREGVENASVDFNAGTLSPTYRIVMGLPGESHAIDIARRNGLSEKLCKAASQYLAGEHADISTLIRGLESRHRELDRKEVVGKKKERALKETERRHDLARLSLRQKELQLRSAAVGDLQALLVKSRKTLENLVRQVKESSSDVDRDTTKAVKNFLQDLQDSVELEKEGLAREAEELEGASQTDEAAASYKADADKAGASYKAGARVRIMSKNREGRIVRRGKKGQWLVEVGALKLELPERDLAPMAAEKLPETVELLRPKLFSPAASFEIKLLGFRMEEALQALQVQLDAAVLEGLGEFSVVHGKGDGILAQAVHDYLKEQSTVLDYYFARPEQGGFGKTIVLLRR